MFRKMPCCLQHQKSRTTGCPGTATKPACFASLRKMHKELGADYKYKYDLLRNLVLELIHYGQKLQPLSALSAALNASERISSLFIELLERQFPLESFNHILRLRTPYIHQVHFSYHI